MAEQLGLFAPRRPAAPPAPAACPRWTSSPPCTAVSEGRAACPGAAPCEQLGEPERERIERSFWAAEVRLGPPGQPPTPPASATPREGIHRVEYRCDCGAATSTLAAMREHVATHPARVPVVNFPKRSPAPVDEPAPASPDLVHHEEPAPQSDAPGPVDEQSAASTEVVQSAETPWQVRWSRWWWLREAVRQRARGDHAEAATSRGYAANARRRWLQTGEIPLAGTSRDDALAEMAAGFWGCRSKGICDDCNCCLKWRPRDRVDAPLTCRGCGAPARVVYAAGVPPLKLAGPHCRTCADGILRAWKETTP